MSGLRPKQFCRCKLTYSPPITVSEDGRSRGKDWKSERMSPSLAFLSHCLARSFYVQRKLLRTSAPAFKSLRLIATIGVGAEEVNEKGTRIAVESITEALRFTSCERSKQTP